MSNKKKHCLFGQVAFFIKILLLTSCSDRRFYHCYLNFSSSESRYQLFYDTTFMKIILNKPRTNCLCLLERALPTVHVFRQIPTGKHNCIPSSYFLSTIGEIYSHSLRKRSRLFPLSELFRVSSTHLENVFIFPFFSPFFFFVIFCCSRKA